MRRWGCRDRLLAVLSACLCQEVVAEKPVHEGFWHVTAGLPVMHMNDEGAPYRFSLGAGYPVYRERVSLMLDLVFSYYEVSGTADEHPRPDISGGTSSSLGFDLLMRIDAIRFGNLSGYLEGGGGFQSMLSDPPFPADGSDQNLTLFIGPGVSIPAGAKTRLTVSLQFFHISNAWLLGNNSGYDGIQLIIGSEWSL